MEIENNLKKYFEHQINNIEVDIDVERAVMSRIATPRKIYNTRALAFLVIFSMCMITTGIAYGQEIITFIKNMDFMNARGEVEWSIRTNEEDVTYRKVATDVFDSLEIEEGKAVSIYVSENNPQNIITSMQKPITVQEIDLINTYNIGTLKISLEKEILEKYLFSHGKVTFDILSESIDQSAMIEEANRTGKSVVVTDVEVSTDVVAISCDYIDNSKTDNQPDFTVTISKWNSKELINSGGEHDNLNDFDRIMIGESEVLYENSNNNKQISWISGEHYFIVSSIQATMTKEELLRIAEQIKIGE